MTTAREEQHEAIKKAFATLVNQLTEQMARVAATYDGLKVGDSYGDAGAAEAEEHRRRKTLLDFFDAILKDRDSLKTEADRSRKQPANTEYGKFLERKARNLIGELDAKAVDAGIAEAETDEGASQKELFAAQDKQERARERLFTLIKTLISDVESLKAQNDDLRLKVAAANDAYKKEGDRLIQQNSDLHKLLRNSLSNFAVLTLTNGSQDRFLGYGVGWRLGASEGIEWAAEQTEAIRRATKAAKKAMSEKISRIAPKDENSQAPQNEVNDTK